jgi:hypothetical protein
MPLVLPITAMPVDALLQVPPVASSVSVVLAPMHKCLIPVMAVSES